MPLDCPTQLTPTSLSHTRGHVIHTSLTARITSGDEGSAFAQSHSDMCGHITANVTVMTWKLRQFAQWSDTGYRSMSQHDVHLHRAPQCELQNGTSVLAQVRQTSVCSTNAHSDMCQCIEKHSITCIYRCIDRHTKMHVVVLKDTL